jgi:hypothetical protein
MWMHTHSHAHATHATHATHAAHTHHSHWWMAHRWRKAVSWQPSHHHWVCSWKRRRMTSHPSHCRMVATKHPALPLSKHFRKQFLSSLSIKTSVIAKKGRIEAFRPLHIVSILCGDVLLYGVWMRCRRTALQQGLFVGFRRCAIASGQRQIEAMNGAAISTRGERLVDWRPRCVKYGPAVRFLYTQLRWARLALVVPSCSTRKK